MFPAMDNFDKIKNFNAVFLPSKNNPKISEKKINKKISSILRKMRIFADFLHANYYIYI